LQQLSTPQHINLAIPETIAPASDDIKPPKTRNKTPRTTFSSTFTHPDKDGSIEQIPYTINNTVPANATHKPNTLLARSKNEEVIISKMMW
jgi:hypothetical protein